MPPRLSDDDLLTRLKSQNYYDCVNVLDPNDLMGGARLFGNRNIGNQKLTNLQIPGSVGYDSHFIIQRWYARTNITEPAPIFHIWANSTPITLVMGMSPQWMMSLRELLDRRPRTDDERPTRMVDGDPWPILVPVRQNVTVEVNSYGATEIDELRVWLRNRPSFQEPGIYPYVWIHIEGLAVPSDWPGISMDRILRLVTAYERKRLPVEEEIVRWITGMSSDPNATDDTKATMSVISDGILEGRHKR